MKIFIKRVLQLILGFETYLYVFARYIIHTLHRNRNEKDFLHFADLLKDGDTILDIGANIGAMTVHLARRFPSSKIYSFEPVPVNIKTLKRIVKHYRLKNVCIMETALGNECGEIEMIMPSEKKVKLHGLSHVVHESITDYNEGERFKTPVITLDSIALLNGGEVVKGIKLDVENFEFFVLEGGKALISRDYPIIYSELWEGENKSNCFKLLTSLRYEAKVLESGKLVAFEPQKHTTQNFFFISKP